MLINLKEGVKSLEQRAYEVIKEMILTGELKPEHQLKEEKMANDLGVSRTTIQKAFIRLKGEYLIEGEPFKGVQVISASLDEALEAYEVRKIFEGYGSRLAARDPDEKILSELIKGFEKLISSSDGLEGLDFQKLNYSFHMMLANSYKNKVITKMIATLIMKTKAFHQKHQVKYFYAKGSLKEHLDILYAIKSQDENRAEILTKKHLKNVKETFIRLVNKNFSEKTKVK